MCELFAVNAARSVDVGVLLKEFYSHSVEHPHGWGLAWHEADGGAVLVKEPVAAHESARLANMLQGPVVHRQAVAHIRRATHGNLAYENSHPFVGQDASGVTWVMAHNGALLDESLTAPYRTAGRGETDSERVLLYLLERIERATERKGAPLACEERFDTLSGAMGSLSIGNMVNLILDDGECTYIHTNTTEASLFVKFTDDAALFSTRPLGDGQGWMPTRQRCLVAYRNGRPVMCSGQHCNCVCYESLRRLLAS